MSSVVLPIFLKNASLLLHLRLILHTTLLYFVNNGSGVHFRCVNCRNIKAMPVCTNFSERWKNAILSQAGHRVEVYPVEESLNICFSIDAVLATAGGLSCILASSVRIDVENEEVVGGGPVLWPHWLRMRERTGLPPRHL